ncbi:hypothetical protein HYR54_04720 [Candidatus Acetothermia bacterium]|nr:hypothetical protein [Candidatus Acetothermia bacterium]
MKAQQRSNGNRRISRLGLVLALTGFIFLGLSSTPRAEAQTSGPLSQYKDNVHLIYIVARYSVPTGTVLVLDGATTATAIRSMRGETFYLIEKDHVDPQYFYRERQVPTGTFLSFVFFVDKFDLVSLLRGSSGDPFEVFKVSDHYAVLRELRTRNLPDVEIASDPQESESAIILLSKGRDNPPTFTETPITISQAPADSRLFFIALAQTEEQDTHGAPVFVQREGAWRLAGIRVAHGRSTQADQSAVAKLPSLDELTSKP